MIVTKAGFRNRRSPAMLLRRRGGRSRLLCTYISAVLLVCLVLNPTLGWSWPD